MGGNLAEVDLILVVNLNDEAPIIHEAVREEVEHSFIGGEEVDSSSYIEKSSKLMKV